MDQNTIYDQIRFLLRVITALATAPSCHSQVYLIFSKKKLIVIFHSGNVHLVIYELMKH